MTDAGRLQFLVAVYGGEHGRHQDQPWHEGREPLRREHEDEGRADQRSGHARQDEPAGPGRLVHAVASVGPGSGHRAGPEADRAGRIGDHHPRRRVGEERGQCWEGQDGAPTGHRVDRRSDGRDHGEHHEAERVGQDGENRCDRHHGAACGAGAAAGGRPPGPGGAGSTRLPFPQSTSRQPAQKSGCRESVSTASGDCVRRGSPSISGSSAETMSTARCQLSVAAPAPAA